MAVASAAGMEKTYTSVTCKPRRSLNQITVLYAVGGKKKGAELGERECLNSGTGCRSNCIPVCRKIILTDSGIYQAQPH